MNARTQNILMTPVGWLLHGIARLPMSMLYTLSAVLYFIIYKVVGYRVQVVRKNLSDSFPEKSNQELQEIEQQFYQNFADYMVETIKLLHISEDELRKRITFSNMEFVERSMEQGRSVMLYGAHLFNWEWICSIPLWLKEETRNQGIVFGQAYRPLNNVWFDRFFIRLRSRWTRSIANQRILREILHLRRDGQQMALGFISDQHPLPGDKKHVIRFLNHPTAMITGTEDIARRLEMSVGYFQIKRRGRGRYQVQIIEMAQNAAETPKGRLTDEYARMLEIQILEDPANWLWTHKRWKRPVTLPQE